MTSFGYIILDSCIVLLDLNCILQLKQFYNIATKVSCRNKCNYFWWSTWLIRWSWYCLIFRMGIGKTAYFFIKTIPRLILRVGSPESINTLFLLFTLANGCGVGYHKNTARTDHIEINGCQYINIQTYVYLIQWCNYVQDKIIYQFFMHWIRLRKYTFAFEFYIVHSYWKKRQRISRLVLMETREIRTPLLHIQYLAKSRDNFLSEYCLGLSTFLSCFAYLDVLGGCS